MVIFLAVELSVSPVTRGYEVINIYITDVPQVEHVFITCQFSFDLFFFVWKKRGNIGLLQKMGISNYNLYIYKQLSQVKKIWISKIEEQEKMFVWIKWDSFIGSPCSSLDQKMYDLTGLFCAPGLCCTLHQSLVHSHTFPTIFFKPNLVAGNDDTCNARNTISRTTCIKTEVTVFT